MVAKVQDFERFVDPETVTMLFDVAIEADNQACFADVKNDRLLELSKHIHLKYQVVIDTDR